MEFWDIDALLVRPYIQQPQDLRNKTIAAPAGSTSHYQLLYFLDLLKLTDAVTVWTAQPSELADLWHAGLIDGAFVWCARAYTRTHACLMHAGMCRSPHLDKLREEFETRTLIAGSGIAPLGAPTFIAYAHDFPHGPAYTKVCCR